MFIVWEKKILFSGEIIIETAHRLEEIAQRRVFVPMKLSLIGFCILNALDTRKARTAGELQKVLRSKKSNIAQRLRILEERGFIERKKSNEDGRQRELFLTRKGKKKVEDVKGHFKKARISLEKHFSQEELRHEEQFFQKLNAFLDDQEKSLEILFKRLKRWAMKRRIFFVVSVLVMIMMFALAFFVPKKSNVEEKPFEQKPIVVSTQFVKERKSFFQEITYPASVVSEQESEVVARSSGTVVAIDASLGSYAHKGAFLAKIDDRGNFSSSVSETFQSEEIQRATLDAEKAEKAVDLFERRYQSLKKTYEEQEDDDTLSKTVTKDQVRAAKIEVDMAKIDEENAKVQLESMINNHIVTSPLGGYVTDIQVSVGDYVSAGETLMMLSQTNAIKIQFWVDQNHFQFLQKGSLVSFRDQYGNAHEAIVENISPRGEMISRRFLVEAIPKENSNNLILGSIITVEASFEKKTLKEENIFLPLSALTLGQNENSIFVVENSKARRVLVDIVRVDGEMAEVSARLSPESEIIVSGNKYVREGDEVVIVR